MPDFDDDYAPMTSMEAWSANLGRLYEAERQAEARHRSREIMARVAEHVKRKAARVNAPSAASDRLLAKAWGRVEDVVKHERAVAAQGSLGWREEGRQPVPVIDLGIDGEIDVAGNHGPNGPIELLAKLRANPVADELLLRIDSRGGFAETALMVYAAIRWHDSRRKVAVVSERCDSAAIMVLLACRERVAAPQARFMLHRTTGGSAADREVSDRVQETVAKIAGVDIAAFKTAVDGGAELNATAAIAMNLITRIADDIDAVASGDNVIRPNAWASAPATFRIVTEGGTEIDLPLDGRVVASLADGFGDMRYGTFMMLGLPDVYVAAAERQLHQLRGGAVLAAASTTARGRDRLRLCRGRGSSREARA